MRPPTPNPTETSLGMFNEREDLLEQVARKSRVARWGRAIARAVLVCAVAIFAILLFVPLGEMIGWVVTYLLPVAVILGVITAVLALLVWVIERLPDPPYRDWMQ